MRVLGSVVPPPTFPATAETDEAHVIQTPFGPRTFRRRAGDLLHPARESGETLEQIRTTLGTYNLAGQYQQTPAPSGGGMVRESWFKRYDEPDLPSFDRIVQSWDTANKPSELADYSVCTTWGIKGVNLYLLNVSRKKLAFPDLKRAVVEQHLLFNATVILIEDRASGIQLIQELRESGLSQVTACSPEGDKIMRLHAQTATIENGFVYIPREAPWLADYLHELTVYPNGRHDDQVDSTSQALAWTKVRPAGRGLLEYYRQMSEEARNPPPPRMVRLKARPGVSHVQVMSGRTLAVFDGHVCVPEEDASPLLGAGFVRA